MSTQNLMPMGISAARLQLDPEPTPDLTLGGHASSLMPQQPAPTQAPATAAPPWAVEMQGDGSSLYTIPGPDGKPLVIGINPPPRLPKAMQPSTMPKPNGASPMASPM